MPSIIAWTISSSIVVIAFSVWGLLMFYAHRSTLETEARKRFAIASGFYLLGWLVLAFVLGSAGVFQATPSRAFSPVAVGIAVTFLTGMFLLSRSSALNAVIAAIPLPWLAGVQLYRVLGFNFLVLYALGRLPGEFAIPAGAGDVVVGLASPGPFQTLALESPNELITAFPLVLVPLYAVPLSILLHLAALKRLKAVSEVASNKGLKSGGQPLRWDSHPAVP